MELFGRTRSQTRILRERTFPSFVQYYFEPFIKAGKESNKFQWSSVDRFYDNFREILTNGHSLKIFYDFVLKLLLAFNCDEVRPMRIIVLIYCHSSLHDDEFSCQDCTESTCRNQMCIKFRSEYTFLQVMLKYRIRCLTDDIKSVDQKFTNLRRNYYKRKDMAIRFDYDDKTHLYKFRKILVNPSWRRLLLIIEIVENVFKRDDNKSIGAECFRLYSLSISEPAITVKEVEDFLDLAFADDRAFRMEALSNFRIVFADIPMLASPRSLKQLCRVKIRDILPLPLPSAVAKLDLLPYYLKNYLLFMCV